MCGKLKACRKFRPLTQEIKDTVHLVQTLLGENETTDYLDALVQLAVDILSLPEIIKRLAPNEASSAITSSRATLIDNGLVAALFLKRQSHIEALLNFGAQTSSHPNSFGEPVYVAAYYADPRTFYYLVDVAMATQHENRRQLLEARLIIVLEWAASAGRVLMFNSDLHDSLERICHHYSRRVYYESALKGAMLAGHGEVGEAILRLLRIEGDGRLMSDNKSFWIEILRLSCSGKRHKVAQQVLDNTGIQTWSGSLDLPLEDASRSGDFELVKLLIAYQSEHNLQSRSGAIFWAARCAHYTILSTLLASNSEGSISTIVDALCGASVSGGSAMSLVLEAAPAWQWASVLSSADCTFAQVIDKILESGHCVSSTPTHGKSPNGAGQSSLLTDEGDPDATCSGYAIFDNMLSSEEITLRGACSRGDFHSIHRTIHEYASQYAGCGELLQVASPKRYVVIVRASFSICVRNSLAVNFSLVMPLWRLNRRLFSE